MVSEHGTRLVLNSLVVGVVLCCGRGGSVSGHHGGGGGRVVMRRSHRRSLIVVGDGGARGGRLVGVPGRLVLPAGGHGLRVGVVVVVVVAGGIEDAQGIVDAAVFAGQRRGRTCLRHLRVIGRGCGALVRSCRCS